MTPSPRTSIRVLLLRVLLFAGASIFAIVPTCAEAVRGDELPKYDATQLYQRQELEGWKLLIHGSLLESEPQLADRTLKLRQHHLYQIAEATEAYFGTNDFFPFVRSELREYDPDCFQLLERIWGKPNRQAGGGP